MSKRFFVLMCSVLLVVPLLFFGCNSGDTGPRGATGATGATGPAGADGAAGPPGPVTTTNESCMVCHTTGRVADVSDSDPASITHYNAEYHNLPLTISAVSITDDGSGNAQVSFHAASGETPVSTLTIDSFTFFMGDLVPAGTLTGLSTPQFERWAYERTGTDRHTGLPYPLGTFDTTDAANGNYVYTFATGFGSETAIVNAPEYDPAHVQRLVIKASLTGYNNVVQIVDFNVADTGVGTTGLGYTERQFVTVDACKKCHGPQFTGAAHASSYPDTRVCVLCHSPIGSVYGEEMVTDEAWLASLVHKIHSAIPMAAFPTRMGGTGYSAVTYPQDVRNCVTCHTNSGLDLGAGDNTANWKTHPTAAGCGTCHTSANFVTGDGHAGGAQPDTACSFCHPATGSVAPTLGASVTEAHDTSATAVLHPTPKNVPEFDVTLSTSAPGNGTFYVAGEVMTVTATLNFHGGAAIPASMYTAAQGPNGVADNLFRTASLYVYGPRAMPKPLLATQATSLFVNAANPAVATDNTGFKYNVTIPSGLANGTYMVRVRFADYGYVSDNNYQLESVAFQNIQIGSATVTLKVAGDVCTECHGTATAPFHDARHVVAFDTDQCVSCHDYSGGHAATLSNRVHAVHSANSYGDMTNPLGETTDRNWDDVKYPLNDYPSSATGTVTSRIDRCTMCHTSGNTSYRSTVGEVSCLGCHGDNPNPTTFTGGATNHMLQNGGKYPLAP